MKKRYVPGIALLLAIGLGPVLRAQGTSMGTEFWLTYEGSLTRRTSMWE
jgi:hypothetical protein